VPTPFANNLINGQLTQASQLNQYGAAVQALESGQSFYQVATGVANAYEVLFPPPLVISAYAPGMIVNFLSPAVNTGPASLQVNGLPPQPIVKNGGEVLGGGEISANQVVAVIHDGTRFHLVGSASGVTSFNSRTDAVLPQPGDYAMAGLPGTAATVQGGTDHGFFEAGELLVANAEANLERLPAGTEGQLLTADVGQPSGLSWAAPPALAPPAYLKPAYMVQVPDAAYGTIELTTCTETDPPILALIGVLHAPPPRNAALYFFYRMNNRWRPISTAGIGVETVRAQLYSMKGPLNTNPSRVVYVPSGGSGPGRGKFWVGSETNEYIRLVNPADLTYEDVQLHPDDAVLGQLVYSPDLNRVFAIAGNGTRVLRIEADTVTVEAASSGWTNLASLALQVDGGVTGRAWVTRTGGGNAVLQWVDATTLAATNTGWAPSYTLGPLVYVPELAVVFVSGGPADGNIPFSLVQATAPYSALLTKGLDFARGYRLAYVPGVGMVARGDLFNVWGLDRATGATVAKVATNNWGAGTSTGLTYEPAYREFLMGTDTTWFHVGV